LHNVVHLFNGDVSIVVHHFLVEKNLLLYHISLSWIISLLKTFVSPNFLLMVDTSSVAAKWLDPFHQGSSSLLQNNNDKHHGEKSLVISLSESDVH